MKSERLRFPNRRGDELSGILDLPDRGDPRHFAIFAHCFTCTKDFKLAINVDRELVAKGIGVLRFDFTGLGQSGGEFSDTNFTTNAEDIEAAADFLGSNHGRPELLIGHSLGGTAALYAASSVSSSVAVVAIATPSEPRHLKRYLRIDTERLGADGEVDVNLAGRKLRITKQFIEDLDRVDMVKKIAGLRRALLVIHSPGDTTVSIENAAFIFQHAAHPKSFISLDGADHLLLKEEDARYVGAFIGLWALRYLDRSGTQSAPTG